MGMENLKMYFPHMDESILTIVTQSVAATTIGISKVANESERNASYFDQFIKASVIPSDKFAKFLSENFPISMLHEPVREKVKFITHYMTVLNIFLKIINQKPCT